MSAATAEGFAYHEISWQEKCGFDAQANIV